MNATCAMVSPWIYPGLRTTMVLINKATISPALVMQVTCEEYGITMDELRGKCRDYELVRARQTAMYIMRMACGMPLKRIGELFFRDHATVLHACTMVDNMMRYIDFSERFNRITKKAGWL